MLSAAKHPSLTTTVMLSAAKHLSLITTVMLSAAKHPSLTTTVMLSAAKHLSLINVAETLRQAQGDNTPLMPRVLPGHSGAFFLLSFWCLTPESRFNIDSLFHLDAGSSPA